VIAANRIQDTATWEKFLRAILRAEKFTAENPQETIDAIAKYVKLDRALLERAYYQPYLDQSSDPNLKGVRQFWQVMQSSDFIPAQNRDIAANVNAGIYQKVLDQLVRENPQDPFWRKLQVGFQQKDAL
jgi:NitT/TauT family transport system substrate-binding protein